MKILVLCGDLKQLGGVTNFYLMLMPYLGKNYTFLPRVLVKNVIVKIFIFLYTLFRFIYYMMFGRYDLVLLNPSLGKTAVQRDMVYAFLTKKIFRKKLMVFWHGWDFNYEKNIDAEMIKRFQQTFFKAEKMFVLASAFEKSLRKWGYQNSVQLMTTCYRDFEISRKQEKSPSQPVQLLFLSRVEIAKGIIELLDAFKIILTQYKEISVKLIIAGDGNSLHEVKNYVEDNTISDIEFTGYIRGKEKEVVLGKSDIFILPSYGEGMPCALLEAMGAGLAVITTGVGGIPDFFENGKMGYMIDSANPEKIADAILKLLNHPDLIQKIGAYNKTYAREHFTAEKVAEKLHNSLVGKNSGRI